MLNDFLNYIKENNLVKKSDRILLAVSGGMDSIVMMHLFIKAGFTIGIAHCNFSLRGNESDLDEELVRKIAKKNRLQFHSIRFDTTDYSKKNGISVEMAARDLRYDWFKKLMTVERYDKVAVAHNLNDNIETLLLNLSRGTGIAGLTGMKVSANGIVRPMLFATRKTIEEYCIKNSFEFREDSSNADVKFKRNRIRHQVIPVLKEINPSIEITLNETAERLAEINEILSSYIEGLRRELFSKKDLLFICGIQPLKEHIGNKTVIYELFRPFGITGRNLNDLYNIFSGRTGGYMVTDSHRILRNRNEIIITADSPGLSETFIAGNLSELKKAPVVSSARTVNITPGFKITGNPSVAYLDHEKLRFPVILRKWRSGDVFYPLGMSKRKKLSDYFIDRKYSIVDKENILILESAGKIAWIVGDRIDNRFSICESTKKALVIKVRQ